jgi:RND family efflux transporter MFP subunit
VRLLTLIGALIALIGASIFWWIYLDPLTVTLISVTRGTAVEVVYATGIVEPVTWAKIAPLARKRLINTCKCEGRQVKAGDEIARQDSSLEQAALDELLARRQMLENDLRRASELLGRNVAAATAVEQASTSLKEIDARVGAAREALDDLILRAPIDGTVLREDFSAGEIVGPGDVIFWVGQPLPLQITADVNEEDIARVKKGQKVLLRHEGFLTDQLAANVSEITPKGDPTTKTFRVRLALPENTPLLIGMSVEANIITAESQDAWLIPAEALSDSKVYLVANGKLHLQAVTTGIRGTRMVEVKSGLSEGIQVISPVPQGAKEGVRVRNTGFAP